MSSESSNIGVILAAIFGGIVVLIVAVAVGLYLRERRKKSFQKMPEETSEQ
jgi:gas vesicle protein